MKRTTSRRKFLASTAAIGTGAAVAMTGAAQEKKDNQSRRGLIQMVSKRRSLLGYLKKVDFKRYIALIKELGLRG